MANAPRDRVEALRCEIRTHDQKYYVEASPVISDLEYDRLMQELAQLESEHPALVTPDSPTQRVGDAPVAELEQVPHRVPMLSIDNSYSVDELRAYFAKTRELLEQEAVEWVVELKIDGVAASLIYEDGQLARAITRLTRRIAWTVRLQLRARRPTRATPSTRRTRPTRSWLR